MEFGTGDGTLRFAPLVVHIGEESFEAGPIFLLCRETFPGFLVVNKEIGMIDELEVYANDLFKAVGSVTCDGVITAVFDPIKKRFNA